VHLTFHKQPKPRDKQQNSWQLAVISSLKCSVSVLLVDIFLRSFFGLSFRGLYATHVIQT